MSGGRDLSTSKRIVVKIGSALLVHDDGRLRAQWLDALAQDIAALRESGAEVMIVSSGAIAVGRRLLRLARGPRNRALRLEESQAAAATGQVRLAHAWRATLRRYRVPVAQILLTIDDTEDRRRHLNARNTIETLLQLDVVPVINENDTVATGEIRFGDNDRLAARVAQMMGADTCVILSDIDGLYTADPTRNAAAKHIPEVAAITSEITAMAGKTAGEDGSGGMITKIEAARVALQSGCRLVIADGRGTHPLAALADGARATWFVSDGGPHSARKRWIGGALKAEGTITIDAGAARALARGNSLLPAGVTAVDGAFKRGDPVIVCDDAGKELARGLVAYGREDAQRILGRQSGEIENILGYRGREEMIHRDDLVES
ncbi:MAG: glutamate 5-kinase [Rhodospirillaceae bacterium]|jgi:glutamate 5-kinase|nr:glutamate 5-kinase [Rhodospirillaceae bacterium]MBT5943294.1 glutamate 5-kinase [Rhodospirillaceae bacterium]MBT6404806.1 glutamate 5-kinase [Rhodospirillaceae bacterium]MBT6536761.1 glutamate 5-kinase [Rhodospirillaceae bacterium]MBT7360529.1 glutamate 5-kinase [Rhodospirillaceae bacterium]